MSLLEQLHQQIQELYERETSVNELRKTIMNTSLKESQLVLSIRKKRSLP
jgi:prefoldin subunit 5